MIHAIFWAVIFVLGLIYAGCWVQLIGKTKEEKQWLWQTPAWLFFPNEFDHPQALRLCKIARYCVGAVVFLTSLFFVL